MGPVLFSVTINSAQQELRSPIPDLTAKLIEQITYQGVVGIRVQYQNSRMTTTRVVSSAYIPILRYVYPLYIRAAAGPGKTAILRHCSILVV